MTAASTKADASRTVRLVPPTNAPVRDRGRLLTARQVAEQIFHGLCAGRWVLDNAPLETRIRVGKRICYYEADMLAWRDTMQEGR